MTPLKQLKNVRQRPDEGFRIWYANEFFDIIFWYEEEGGFINGFQFCYGKPHTERAYTWELDTSSHHFIRDDKTHSAGILRGNAGEINPKVLKAFKLVHGEMPDVLVKFVLSKLTGIET